MKFFIKRVQVVASLALLALAVSALGWLGGFCSALSGDTAVLPTFADADAALRRAFAAVWEAESAGANVSRLLTELDLVGRNLTEAEVTYAAGNTSKAMSMASQCAASADLVAGEAANFKSQAVAKGRTAMWQAISFSLVGVFAFLIALVLVWVLFRRSYGAQLLKAKPEVAANA